MKPPKGWDEPGRVWVVLIKSRNDGLDYSHQSNVVGVFDSVSLALECAKRVGTPNEKMWEVELNHCPINDYGFDEDDHDVITSDSFDFIKRGCNGWGWAKEFLNE